MSKQLADRFFVQTRKSIRAQLRRKHGRKGFKAAWQDYQAENRGKPKTMTFYVRMWVDRKKKKRRRK